MFVLDDLSKETIENLILESVNQDTVIVTNAFSSHMGIKEFFQHFAFVEGKYPERVVTSNLPWVHIIAGECRMKKLTNRASGDNITIRRTQNII